MSSHKNDPNQADQPLYMQVALTLKERIRTGHLKIGERLPGELTLTKDFKVSRITIRAALAYLEKEGLIVRRQGKGSFVSQSELRQPLHDKAKTIIEALQETGVEPSVAVLGLDMVKPSPAVTEALETSDEQVVHLRRVFSLANLPIALVDLYLPMALGGVANVVASDVKHKKTTYSVFEDELKLPIQNALHRFKTVPVDAEIAKALSLKEGDHCLCVERITKANNGSVLELMVFYYPPGGMNFEITLPRHEPQVTLKLVEENNKAKTA